MYKAYYVFDRDREIPMKLPNLLLLLLLWLTTTLAHAESLIIAAAADLKFAMDEITAQFRLDHPEDQINVVYGSSGKIFTQLQQDAPYDLFFSADISYPEQLAQAGLAVSTVTPYALGRIVLWSSQLDASAMTLQNLKDPAITRIAIANPKHAPYGKRAEEALRAAGLWDEVEDKLVYGENIAQTAQFVQTGNAQIGIIALSLALNPELAKDGKHYLIPDTLHQPLLQGYVITRRAANKPLAKIFADFMESTPVKAVMDRYGFVRP